MKEIALVIGNGPSVDSLRKDILPKLHSFGCNHIYKKFSEWGRPTDNIVITDYKRIVEIGRAYAKFGGNLYVGAENYIVPPVRRLEKILGRKIVPLRQLVKPKLMRFRPLKYLPFHHYLHSLVFDKVRFSFDWDVGFNFGYSVVVSAIQIAVIQGYKTVLLTGVDSNYVHPTSYFRGMEGSVSYVNSAFVSDPRIWMEPILVSLQVHLEKRGVRLVDCTPGGKLRFIEKGRVEDFI